MPGKQTDVHSPVTSMCYVLNTVLGTGDPILSKIKSSSSGVSLPLREAEYVNKSGSVKG